jgi:hypothetical protein
MSTSRTIPELDFLSNIDYTLFEAQLSGVLQRIRNGESQEDINDLLEIINKRYTGFELKINKSKEYEIIRKY